MAGSSEIFDERDNPHERRTLDSERRIASTPLLEVVRTDNDLDPPTWFPPNPAS